jgi:aspartate aminotransferase
VVVDGVAKGFAMTGWRIGWAVAPPSVARAMGAFQSHTTSNAAAPSQHAALAALTLGPAIQPALDDMLSELTARRAVCLELLRAAPAVRFIEPQGAFYFFIHAGDWPSAEGDPGGAFAQHLLDTHGVAVVPGSAFLTPDWIRISFAAPMASVTEGLRRIIGALLSSS